MTGEYISIHVSEALLFFVGQIFIVGILLFVKSRRLDVLGVAIVLLGTAIREGVIPIAGPGYWMPWVFWVSACARSLKIVGLAIIVYDWTREAYGAWVCVTMLAASFGAVALLSALGR